MALPPRSLALLCWVARVPASVLGPREAGVVGVNASHFISALVRTRTTCAHARIECAHSSALPRAPRSLDKAPVLIKNKVALVVNLCVDCHLYRALASRGVVCSELPVVKPARRGLVRSGFSHKKWRRISIAHEVGVLLFQVHQLASERKRCEYANGETDLRQLLSDGALVSRTLIMTPSGSCISATS